MRLIDADALLRPISSYNPVKYTYEYGDVVTVQDIKSIPTIDAVPVVRCRDCMNWDISWIPRYYKDGHYCPFIDLVTDGEFYCSYAERKTNDVK